MTWNTIEASNMVGVVKYLSESKEAAYSKGAKVSRKNLMHRLIGNVLWTVDQMTVDGVVGLPFISCHIIRYDVEAGNYIYNTMTEANGIAMVNCPVSFFDVAPFVYDIGWRSRVQKFNSMNKNKFRKVA